MHTLFSHKDGVQKEEYRSVVLVIVEMSSLMQFLRHGRIECDGCQKGENSIALEHRRERVLAKGFRFNIRDSKCLCVCRRMKLPGKGIRGEKVRGRSCDRYLTVCGLFWLWLVTNEGLEEVAHDDVFMLWKPALLHSSEVSVVNWECKVGSQIKKNYSSATWREQRHRWEFWLLQQAVELIHLTSV